MSDTTDVDVDAVLEFASRLHARAAGRRRGVRLAPAADRRRGSGRQRDAGVGGRRRRLRGRDPGHRPVPARRARRAAVAELRGRHGRPALPRRRRRAGRQHGRRRRRLRAGPGPDQHLVPAGPAPQALAERAAREALRAQNQVGATRPRSRPTRTSSGSATSWTPGARTAPTDDRYSRATDAVAAHDEQIGDDGGLAEAGYDPAGDPSNGPAHRRAAHRGARHPYTVVVDDNGVSEVVQADPDDVPDPDPDADVVQEQDQQAADLAAALGGAG